MNNLRTILLPSLLPIFLFGCQFYRAPMPVAGYYYLNPDKSLSDIGRVALVELNNKSSYPEVGSDVTRAIFEAVQKKQVFGLTVVRQNDQAWRNLQVDLDSTYNLEQLSEAYKTLKCSAVLTGTITEYQPYPHLILGLRLKLVDLKDGQLIWALEQVWDSTDKTTGYRISNYVNGQIRSGSMPLREQLVGVSPLRFISFVAYEVAQTLGPEK
jgi:hypothetical protein